MIENWINREQRSPNPYSFEIYDLVESIPISTEIKEYLAQETLAQYRNVKWLKSRFKDSSETVLREYLKKNVFPDCSTLLVKNVRQGDFGEIISKSIIEKFQNLKVPISKLRYKFNKDRSVFCTDLISINQGNTISDIKYYEVKTRITYSKATLKDAYEGLLKDERNPTETIADFLDRLFFEKAEEMEAAGKSTGAKEYYSISEQFGQIVKDPTLFNRSFEIILIIEKSTFKEEMIEELNSLTIALNPFEVSIFLVDNFKEIENEVFQEAEDVAVRLVSST